MKAAVPFVVVERAVGTNGRGVNARKVLDALQQLGPKRVLLLVCFVLRVGQRNFEIYDPLRIETERRVLSMPETFQGQSRTGEQNDCERYLRDHETRAHAVAAWPVARTAISLPRASARASCRFATFAHAIKSTQRTAASNKFKLAR